MTEKYRNIQHKLTRFFKCRHLVWLTVLCIALAGCKDDFDDSELRKQIADLDGRLTADERKHLVHADNRQCTATK